jgi:uncharacterized membrane protein YdbT with pleckstrin-like domain
MSDPQLDAASGASGAAPRADSSAPSTFAPSTAGPAPGRRVASTQHRSSAVIDADGVNGEGAIGDGAEGNGAEGDGGGSWISPADMGVVIPDTRLHPIYLIIETARALRSAIPFLVVTILGGAPWWVNAALFVVVMIVAVAQWQVKKYSVISGVLRLRTGVFNRMVRVVPITRITALDAYRSFLQRLIGVWALKVQSPGDRNGSAVVLGSLSGRRLDQLLAALDVRAPASVADPPPQHTSAGASPGPQPDGSPTPGTAPPARSPADRTTQPGRLAAPSGPPVAAPAASPAASPAPSPGTAGKSPGRWRRDASTLQRYLSWRRSVTTAAPKESPDVVAVLRTREMLFAAITTNTIPLIFAVAVVVWFQFSAFVPSRAADFMHTTVEPRGTVAVLVALVVVAVVLGVVNSALRLNKFTLVRDGDVLRRHAGLLGIRTATIPVKRVQAVRIVEGLWRAPFGYCSLQVEVAGIGAANVAHRTVFPLLKTAHARALISRALPEMHWPDGPLRRLPERVHPRYRTVPLEYAAGFTLLLLFLPGWWRLAALAPLPLAWLLAARRARECAWQLDDRAVILRWRRVFARNTVIAHRTGAQRTEWESSPWKARAGVAGFTMRFSSGRRARIRYMVDSDALLLLRVVGRTAPTGPSPASRRASPVGQYR